MMKKFFIVFIFITAFVSAQSSVELFEKANTLYQKEKYEEAILLYNTIIEKGDLSSELYYNLGNCFFKLNNVASSIYSYEKALQLDNSNGEAKSNLVLANLLKVDRIKKLPNNFWENVELRSLQKLSFENWGLLAVLFSFIGVICFVFYYSASNSPRKRLFFIASFISIVIMVSSFTIALDQHEKVHNAEYAIIYSKEVKVQVEPVESSSNLLILHEGEKVQVIDSIAEWKKIKIVNGTIGWVLGKKMKQL